jgi:hypothetical protein
VSEQPSVDDPRLIAACNEIADLKAAQIALEGVVTFCLCALLAKEPKGQQLLTTLRSLYSVTVFGPNAVDTAVVKLMADNYVEQIIDKIETYVRSGENLL